MKDQKIHIICLDAPSPPDYGGAIDMYYKIKSLATSGTRVILHYFNYKEGRGAGNLAEMCERVYTYKRIKRFSFNTPYIIASRVNKELVNRLNEDKLPILFEGIHTTGIIRYLNNKHRSIMIRMHNNEAAYYKTLAESERNLFRKIYFIIESKLLNKYQSQLEKKLRLACISGSDASYFKQNGIDEVFTVPAFIPFDTVQIQPGKGEYCLYHGNIGIAENEKAAEWLISEVFSKLDIPFFITGKNISSRLKVKWKQLSHVSFIDNPTDEKLEDLIENCQVHVLPSTNNTGVKLKIIHALLRGRHCLVNDQAISGSELESYCHIANSKEEFISSINKLMAMDITTDEMEKRKEILKIYDNNKNAEILNEYLR